MNCTVKWLPIEEAPKDKNVLVCYEGASICFQAHCVYHKENGVITWVWRNDEGLIELPDYFCEFPKTPFVKGASNENI